MKGDIEEGARLVNLLSDLIHEEFPDALIIRGASIQFIVLTGVDDVTKRLQYIHNEAKEVRPEYNIIVKAGVYVAKDEHILPITACDYAKAACANIKSDVHSIYQIYDDELNQSLTIRNYVISHFNMALKNHDIKVYYQPIIRSLTQKACGAEALARWENPTYGTLIPGSFISALEDMHLIPDFDLYIAEEVCRDYSRLKEPMVYTCRFRLISPVLILRCTTYGKNWTVSDTNIMSRRSISSLKLQNGPSAIRLIY